MKNISIRQAPNDNRTYLNQNNITPQMNEVLEINAYILKKGNISFMIIILKTRMNVIIKSISYELKLTPNEFSMTANQLFKTIDELYLYIKNIFEKKNVIIQDINNRVMKLILGAYDIMKGGMKQIEIYLLVNRKKQVETKNKDQMAFVNAEDEFGSIEVILFPKIFEKNVNIDKGNIIKVTGMVERRNSDYQLIANNIEKMI